MFYKIDTLNKPHVSRINSMLQTNDNTGVIGIYRSGNALDVYIESGSYDAISLLSYHAKVPGWGWHTSNILSEWDVIC